MDPKDLQAAEDFCRAVDAPHLFAWLGLDPEAGAEAILAALAEKRRYMQGMQSNPKFKDSAKRFIKGYAAFQRIAADPEPHLARAREAHEAGLLPTLELAIDSILADRMVTPVEEGFVRSSALSLGISLETYEAVLKRKADAVGVPLPGTDAPAWSGSAVQASGAEVRGAEGHGWWDAAFTRLLLEHIPPGPAELVDIYCRTGLSAVTLLPVRRQLQWLGVDRSPERVEQARQALPGHDGRVSLMVGEPHALPLPDQSADYALCIRALANLDDTRPVLAEAWRVLRPGGRLLAVEPDGLSERFFFDGHLVDYGQAFGRLAARVDEFGGVDDGGRAGIALGPKLAARMLQAGFAGVRVHVHATHSLEPRPFRKLARRLRRYPQAMAQVAGLGQSPELAALNAEVDRLEAAIPPDRVGLGGHVLPLFVAVGVKEG